METKIVEQLVEELGSLTNVGRLLGISRQRVWQILNRDKERANKALRQAVKNGTVIRPKKCENCGLVCKPEAHHADYERRFEVSWLCIACHKQTKVGTKYKKRGVDKLNPDS
jgi:recombinational DNA repair protein RecR